LLGGCAAEETFETVSDEIVQPVLAQSRQIILALPEEAAAPAAESDGGALYQCEGYEIMVQTLEGGDLDRTLRELTGYAGEELTVLETQGDGGKRYELVWASAGENGPRIGRAMIVDDGSYHYCVSTLADADRAEEFRESWRILFGSISLS